MPALKERCQFWEKRETGNNRTSRKSLIIKRCLDIEFNNEKEHLKLSENRNHVNTYEVKMPDFRKKRLPV